MKEKLATLFATTFGRKPAKIEEIPSHGSNRKYFRLCDDRHKCVGVYNEDRKENEAFVDYALQMKAKGVAVPEIYALDLDNNLYLQQDLGDTSLQTFLQNHNSQERVAIYKKVLQALIEIQFMPDFDYTRAYPRKSFDKQSIRWDLDYFKYCFLKPAHISFDEQNLEKDFDTLTDYLLSCKHDYFLYRDFQSRNILIYNNKLYFIDFQGGRQGALQYDVASLLFSSKSLIGYNEKEELLNYYLDSLCKRTTIDRKEFTLQYRAYCLARLLQVLGAYGYRGFLERKESFLNSIPKAVDNLEYLTENHPLPIYLPELDKIIRKIINTRQKLSLLEQDNRLTLDIRSFSFKKGYPMDTSGNGGGFIFDCRALPNPGRETRFQSLTGKDAEVIKYLESKPEVEDFYSNVKSLVLQSTENYLQRNFDHLMVCFGCTGGRHRSVYFAERLARDFAQIPDLKIVIKHIEQDR